MALPNILLKSNEMTFLNVSKLIYSIVAQLIVTSISTVEVEFIFFLKSACTKRAGNENENLRSSKELKGEPYRSQRNRKPGRS